ncbi:unnamed protein product, partial [marine sediment metagenome]
MDTKGPELAYIAQKVTQAGCRSLLMDVGVNTESLIKADIPVGQVASVVGDNIATIR